MEYIYGRMQQATRYVGKKVGLASTKPDFYKYLKLCALEMRKTGDGKSWKRLDKYKVSFIMEYVDAVTSEDSSWEHTSEQKEFLNEFVKVVKRYVETQEVKENSISTSTVTSKVDSEITAFNVDLSSGGFIFELGRNSVYLCFTTISDTHIRKISFNIEFPQLVLKLPESSDKITVSYNVYTGKNVDPLSPEVNKAYHTFDITDDIFAKKKVGSQFYDGDNYVAKPQAAGCAVM